MQGLLQEALSRLSPLSGAQGLVRAAEIGPAPAAEGAALPEPMPWIHLAANRSGQLIENQDDASYRPGVAGEQRTAGVLTCLERTEYRVLDSV